jgi:metal-responsive CopG/Arc/MetJ family transcriptional regulator
MKTIAITIEEDILERIDRLAGKHGSGSRNRSQVIRTAVREYLTRSERLADEEREGEILRKNRGRLARQAAALVKEQAKS